MANLWPNADLESGIADWTSKDAGTLLHSSTRAWQETYSLEIDTNAESYAGATSDEKAVDESTQYTLSFYYWINDSGVDFRVYITDQDSNFLFGETIAGATSGSWVRHTAGVITTGAGDTGVVLQFSQHETTIDTLIYIDAIQLETGGTANTWENYSSGIEFAATVAAVTDTQVGHGS